MPKPEGVRQFGMRDDGGRKTIGGCGTWFSIGGDVLILSGNAARVLNGLCKYAGKGENNYASHKQLVRHVWPKAETVFFGNLKSNLVSSICWLRESGLRKVILTRYGFGYYWSPEADIKIVSIGPKIAESSYQKQTRVAEQAVEDKLRRFRRDLSHLMEGQLGPLSIGALLPNLKEAGFTNAECARFFGVSRQTIGYHIKGRK
jgi:DNA-binding winged helix-turn-helix (wHTH) protein